MSNFYFRSNAVGTIPNQFPFNLIHIFDPVLQPDSQVLVFIDNETDPHFADLYSQEIADAIYWIGFSEGQELNSYEIRHICDHIYSSVFKAQGEK